MAVPYENQTLDHPNPIARFAHRTRFARSKSIVLSLLPSGGTVVDFGCGQGRFLHELREETQKRNFDCDLLGYDPFMAAKFDGYEVLDEVNSIPDASADVITCLEVCEHLSDEETAQFIAFVESKLALNGRLLVTVPIMMGPALLVKEATRSLLFRRLPDTGARDLVAASLLAQVPPRAENIKNSHRGYDWRRTRRILQNHFSLQKIEFSPLRGWGWYGNSQAMMVWKRKK